jgi:hypothetical protein
MTQSAPIIRLSATSRWAATAFRTLRRARLVEEGPDLESDGVVRWRRIDLKRKINEDFGVVLHERTVGKHLAELGFVRISVRPQRKLLLKGKMAASLVPNDGLLLWPKVDDDLAKLPCPRAHR